MAEAVAKSVPPLVFSDVVFRVEENMALSPVAHESGVGQLAERAGGCGVTALGLTREPVEKWAVRSIGQ